MLTFTKRPGPHADTAWAVVGLLAQLKLWLACSRELMSCVGRLCKDYLYLYNFLLLIPTPPLIMAVNIGEAVGCPLPSKPSWLAPQSLTTTYQIQTLRHALHPKLGLRRNTSCLQQNHFNQVMKITSSSSCQVNEIGLTLGESSVVFSPFMFALRRKKKIICFEKLSQ